MVSFRLIFCSISATIRQNTHQHFIFILVIFFFLFLFLFSSFRASSSELKIAVTENPVCKFHRNDCLRILSLYFDGNVGQIKSILGQTRKAPDSIHDPPLLSFHLHDGFVFTLTDLHWDITEANEWFESPFYNGGDP